MASTRGTGKDGPLETGMLYGGDFNNQQRVGMMVNNPATGESSGPYDPWPRYPGPLGRAAGQDQVDEMQRQQNAYLRSKDARGFAIAPAATPATIAASAGFPVGAAASAYAPPKAPLNPQLVTPAVDRSLPPPVTRFMPDWVHNVFADAMGVERLPPTPVAPWITALGDMLPGRGAVAASPETTAPAALSRINATPTSGAVAKPLAPWYERMGLVPSSQPPPINRDGVRG